MSKPICEETAIDDAVLIFDDSVEAKPYSDVSDLICWHFDHTVGKSVKGVNFITALYHSWKMSIPVNVKFVHKDKITIDIQNHFIVYNFAKPAFSILATNGNEIGACLRIIISL